MELKYKKIDQRPYSSYNARRETIPCLEDNWHFHEEFELIYFLKSNGIRYVGNTVSNFEAGEIYLIGSNLPHLFKNKKEYYNEQEDFAVDLIIVQFSDGFLGEKFEDLPETKNLKRLLQKSASGLMFSRLTSSLLHNQLTGLINNSGLSGIVNLLTVLDVLSQSEDYKVICSQAIVNTFKKREKERMSKVINFMTENYDRKIELDEIAEIANMAPNAFCRFFKKRTQKSFSQYLTEIRIGNACKLLIEGRMQISEISYVSGFNSLSNFNRKFKSVMGNTPSNYIRNFAHQSPEPATYNLSSK